jgi:class 3 adenylate cyclase/predicted ATPase
MPDIAPWLDQLGLGQYAPAFLENDIDFEVLPDLTEGDLERLGLSLGHRKKLLRAIASLPPGGAAGVPSVQAPGGAGWLPPPAAGARGDAQRRHLTVLFCDLVGSTALSTRFDPEELREVLHSYQSAAAGEIARFDGHLAQYLGDGVVAYFGWPLAHEDDAERAVRAALAMTEATARLRLSTGARLAARAGIATGLVVVGDLIGEGIAQQETVVGETPNLAARLQALAAPGAVVVSETTRRLIGDLFSLDDLGQQELKGIDRPVRAFQVVRAEEAESRFEARQRRVLLPMVGRDPELALLLERWRQAAGGEGRLVLLSGEAGIGKSRITRALSDALAAEPHLRVGWQCSPYHADSALYPAIQHLGLTAGFVPSDTEDERLDKLEALLAPASVRSEVAALLAGMLSLPADRYPPLALAPPQRRARTLQALVEALLGHARRQPVLFVLEDLHWVDPTTLEFVKLLADAVGSARIMALVTTRPFVIPVLGDHPQVTRIELKRLAREATGEIIGRLTGGKTLPEEVMAQILARTDGMPLFVEELTKTVLESGLLQESDAAYFLTGPLPPLAIPSSLHDSLMARLDRLAPVREVAQIAAVIGREFSHELLSAVSPLGEADLQAALERLIDAELIYRREGPPGATYVFKHALVRDAAYESLLKSTRQLAHDRIVNCLEAQSPAAAPEEIAWHAEQAGANEKAVRYWLEAGLQSRERSAEAEAIGHLTKGLALLDGFEATPARDARELRFLTPLGTAFIASRGYAAPEVGPVFRRARELCERAGDPPQLFAVMRGNFAWRVVRGEFRLCMELSAEALELAERLQDPGILMEALFLRVVAMMYRGDFAGTRDHCARALANYDDRERTKFWAGITGEDSGVAHRCYLALALWHLGFPDQALQLNGEMRRLARSNAHPFSLGYALHHTGWLCQNCRLGSEAEQAGEEAVRLGIEHGFALWQATGTLYQASGMLLQDRLEEGLPLLRSGLDAYRATGAGLALPYYLSLLGEAETRAGRFGEARRALEEGLALAEANDDRFQEAELRRLTGELLLAESPAEPPAAESCFHQAIETARRQGSRAWELRAAMSLARLWQQQGRRSDAQDALAAVYNTFTEGFSTPDLVAAAAILHGEDSQGMGAVGRCGAR